MYYVSMNYHEEIAQIDRNASAWRATVRLIRWVMGVLSLCAFIVFLSMDQTVENAVVPGLWFAASFVLFFSWVGTFALMKVVNAEVNVRKYLVARRVNGLRN